MICGRDEYYLVFLAPKFFDAVFHAEGYCRRCIPADRFKDDIIDLWLVKENGIEISQNMEFIFIVCHDDHIFSRYNSQEPFRGFLQERFIGIQLQELLWIVFSA